MNKTKTTAAVIAFAGMVSATAHAILIHRYELNQNYMDSVGLADGRPIGEGINGYGENAVFNPDTPAGTAEGASAYSLQVGMNAGTVKSGFAAPGALVTTASAGSISMWVKASVAAADGVEDFIFVSYLSSGATQLDMDAGALTGDAKIGSHYKGNAFRLTENSWDHLVVTWDANGVGTVYQNGVATFTTSPGAVDATPDAGDLRIGNKNMDNRNSKNFGNQFSGSYYDIQVYDEALTPEEVNFLYKNPGSIVSEPTS